MKSDAHMIHHLAYFPSVLTMFLPWFWLTLSSFSFQIGFRMNTNANMGDQHLQKHWHFCTDSYIKQFDSYCWTRTFLKRISVGWLFNVVMKSHIERMCEFILQHSTILKSRYPRCYFISIWFHNRILYTCINSCPIFSARSVWQRNAMHIIQDQTRQNQKHVDTISRQRKVDRARKNIFQGSPVNGKAVENILAYSMTPVQVCDKLWLHAIANLLKLWSALSKRLLPHGFDFYQMFVVDPMHDIESGVWKDIFVHLVWILTSKGQHYVAELNRRYKVQFL